MSLLPFLDLGLGLLDRVTNFSSANKNRDAQREANETNLQIARETNDTNIKNTQATNETILASGKATNDANLQIAREANLANAALADADRRAQLAQWKRENEYNSPVEQAARFRAAGLNPALASGDNGNAGSLQLRTSDPAVVPTLANPADGMSAPVSSAMATMVAPQWNMDLRLSELYSNFLDNAYKGEQLEGANIDNQIKRATQRSQIQKMLDEAKKAGHDAEASRLEELLKKLDYDIKVDTKDDVVGEARAARKRQEHEADSAGQKLELDKLEVAAKQEENKFLEKYHGKQLDEMTERIRAAKQAISIAAAEDNRNSKRFEHELEILKQNAKAAQFDKDYKEVMALTLAKEYHRRYDRRFYYIDKKTGNKVWQSAVEVEDALQSTPLGRLSKALGITGNDMLNALKALK